MKLHDIAKSAIDVLTGESRKRKHNLTVGVKEQIEDIPSPIYYSSPSYYPKITVGFSKSWMDYDVYVHHNNYYRQREQIMYEHMRHYAMQQGMYLTDCDFEYKKKTLNKNIKIL